ncbi:hypothetical protein DL98DRAFT_611829 [Cadophora sp. DSE1049]|nr:hypothetical protein DL98DRAFT_611829 [Cadophora sp. DSE1049]
MGLFDDFLRFTDKIDDLATEGARGLQEGVDNLTKATETLKSAFRDPTEVAKEMILDISNKIDATATEMKAYLQRLVPSFDSDQQGIIDKISGVASLAAESGLDITDAINGAVNLAIASLNEALKSAIDSIEGFLNQVKTKLLALVEQFLSGYLSSLLHSLRTIAQAASDGVHRFADWLKTNITKVLDDIRKAVNWVVEKVGKMLGPVWNFIKILWKILFGVEPEHCQLAAEWFAEKMKHVEHQLLNKHQAKSSIVLVKRHSYLALLGPNEDTWKSCVLQFLDRKDNIPGWFYYQEQVKALLARKQPKPGNMLQVIWDEPFIDDLGGQQRIQICVLYFRWKTEEFSKVSSGMLSILVMVTAVGPLVEQRDTTPVKARLEIPLQLEAAQMKKIYDETGAYQQLKERSAQDLVQHLAKPGGINLSQSRQLMWRGDDGIWRNSIDQR